MNVLGLRASPKEVTFCVYNTEYDEIVNVEEIKIPNALETPERLKYVRATILDVLREFNIVAAGLRLTEFNARSPNFERIQLEGVIQESFASSTLQSYYQGALVTIASKLGDDKTRLSNLIKTANDYERVPDWDEFSEKEREAILTAIGAGNVE
ncbi:hypothetical protein HG547_06140 [Shewanella sp. DNRA4]|uniref:hypothetical protein n=1 Tax=Shewanella sp. DNRA4 TaxID=2723055 RepID=UPI00146DCAFE|nr:hypothetical protein [Shewanella sp. DNRA4]NMD51217.1 hypothetical protein [Shewanella sp. DNRA4]